jgi:uncharacterized protein YjbI with pentapeptide repeats
MSDTNVTKANLAGTYLHNAILTRATLFGVRSGRIIGSPGPRGLPPFWRFASGYLIGPYANLNNATLINAALSNIDLSDVRMAGANLSGANVSWSALSRTMLAGANLTNATLTGSELRGANLKGANLTGAVVANVLWVQTICPDATHSETNGTNPESCAGHGGGL